MLLVEWITGNVPLVQHRTGQPFYLREEIHSLVPFLASQTLAVIRPTLYLAFSELPKEVYTHVAGELTDKRV